jgi:hypothetical protein
MRSWRTSSAMPVDFNHHCVQSVSHLEMMLVLEDSPAVLLAAARVEGLAGESNDALQ